MSQESRYYSGHMDFEYNNRVGPVDEKSPWMQAIRNQPQQQGQTRHGETDSLTKKRPFSVFDSPQKSFSDLRNPSGAQLFSQTPRDTRAAAFMTPRNSHEVEMPSSGPETSPDNADNEATPDQSLTKGIKGKGIAKIFTGNFRAEGQHSPLAKRSSGRGSIDPYSGAVAKRRRHNNQKQILRQKTSSSTFEEENSSAEPSPTHDKTTSKSQNQPLSPRQSTLTNLFHFIDTHPSLPHILSFYAQLALNIALIAFFLYLLYTFYATIRSDIDKKASEARADVLATIAGCAKQFRDNGCESAARLVPALEAPCAEWRRCMARDADTVARARLSAHTFAEIFNEFVEPISWKAMAFFVATAVCCFGLGNGAFSLFRNRHAAAQQPFVPPTPQHAGPTWAAPSGWAPPPPPPDWGYYPPAAAARGVSPVRTGIEPGPSGDGARSPSRGLEWR